LSLVIDFPLGSKLQAKLMVKQKREAQHTAARRHQRREKQDEESREKPQKPEIADTKNENT
jgi:hypothetical protein